MLISLLVMVLSIATDQFTKHLTLLHLKDKAPVSLIDGVLELHFIPIPALPGACWKDSFFHCLYGNCILSVMLFFVLRLPEQKNSISSTSCRGFLQAVLWAT